MVVEPDTPQPFYLRGPQAADPPAVMAHHERSAMRNAAYRAKRLYPGPVGDLVSRELLAWEDLGYRSAGLAAALTQNITAAPAPVQPGDEVA